MVLLLRCVYTCRDQGLFRSFVGAIRANGGGDGPEDIMGGLNKTFWKLSWRQEASKVNSKESHVQYKHAVYTVELPIMDPPTRGQLLYKGHGLWHQLKIIIVLAIMIRTSHQRTASN